MATSGPPEPLWPAEASPAEQALWRWAIERLPDRVRVLSGVHLTDLRDGQRDCEVDVVLIDPDWGVQVVSRPGTARQRRWDTRRPCQRESQEPCLRTPPSGRSRSHRPHAQGKSAK